jgi:hypothetical protein
VCGRVAFKNENKVVTIDLNIWTVAYYDQKLPQTALCATKMSVTVGVTLKKYSILLTVLVIRPAPCVKAWGDIKR